MGQPRAQRRLLCGRNRCVLLEIHAVLSIALCDVLPCVCGCSYFQAHVEVRMLEPMNQLCSKRTPDSLGKSR